ncbi:thiamine phosphate synthase [Lentilactobacillus laojiaonis]|uniref:thiamine phosphate synthase n=1 Tax=Lentilactobacillus laojiaonis TaxID=2883998 RepID=UPI001D0BBD77|nr:thiamine phosphate synthase [Lentilactobacillus laojiaonis]UDM31954.1 thiamine phosphate synthase [Lentilactobacillus laojiaonis]
MNSLNNYLTLYAVTDRHWVGKQTFIDQIKEALAGGITCLQLREKDLPDDQFLAEAQQIKTLCDSYHVPLIINDNVQIAKQVDAAGVHIGQSDTQLQIARDILGPHKIIGVSAHTIQEALAAQKGGADYLGVGAIFTTNSKKDAEMVSLNELNKICHTVTIPVVAIGGITDQNLGQLKGTGIQGISVISAIFAQSDIQTATMKLKQQVEEII